LDMLEPSSMMLTPRDYHWCPDSNTS
jgi:hypothetical protein